MTGRWTMLQLRRQECRLLLFICWVSAWRGCEALPPVIKVGGLFDNADDEQEFAFRVAIDRINNDNGLLRSRLVPHIERLDKDDSFRATKKVCTLLGQGIAGIFGPSSDVTSIHVQSICDALDIPHIEMRWDFQLQRDDLSINLFPKPSVLAKAYVDLIKTWRWESFALVYEDHEGIIRLQDFLKEARSNDWVIQMYQFHMGQPYRDLFWKIKVTEETRIVLDVKRENLFTALKHAQQVGMLTERHSYLITSLDLHTVDLEEFKYGQTRITGYRLVDVESPELQGFLKDWAAMSSRKDNRIPVPETIRTETALMYDAVKLFANGLNQLDSTKSVEFPVISCDVAVSSSDGSSLINLMKPISIQGLTGLVSFDPQGFRSSFVLDIMALKSDGLQKVGRWTPRDNVTVDENATSDYNSLFLQNKTLIVTTVLTPPYMMLKESAKDLVGNDRYEGYCVDLMQELSHQLNFNYEIQQVKDSAYGLQNEAGEWNGMIGEVVSGKADLAIADLTITSKREVAVDFTMPFMNTGISILFKKPTEKVTTLFSFLWPFSMEVWAYVVGAYVGVSVVLFLVGRLSPYEWDNPHPCRQQDQVLENNFSLLNSLWFTIGSLMQQGSDLAPKAMSTRTVAGIWYFFTLIMISSYTANLAAFLTVEKTNYPIENAEDLAKQTSIKYGCLKSGSTRSFFAESKIPTYRKMHKYMLSHEEVYVASNDEGVDKVMAGDYAYLMESASIEYIIERNCNLTQIGGLLDNKGYGIVTKKKSPYRQILSSGILKLQEAGKLHSFKEKWWKERKGGGKCADDSKKSSAVTELSLANVGGVFVVLLGGLGLASVVAIMEFLYKARKSSREGSGSLCKEMLKQLKFAISCRSSTMPAKSDKPLELESNGGDYRIATVPSFQSDF
ncbi:glutamate receptor ionotropic, kainate 3-like [Ornithodoros turicata]|uniref:glutamate receptor ionotropic, kainate 3-like n=1 Tax=Ornithodoros turicata TaxID=34597 RepID=UPI003138AAC1